MNNNSVSLENINNKVIQKLLAPMVYLSILIVVGIPGNLMVLIIYWKRYSKSVYRSIILTLGFTDLFFCTIALPFNIARIVRYYTFYNQWVCKCFTTIMLFNVFFSSHLIVLLSIHRFRQVCMPLKSQISLANIKYWIAGGFLLAMIFDVPQFFLQSVDQVDFGYNTTGYICAISFKNTVFADIYNGFSTFMFVAYALSLFVLYLIIGRKMYIRRKSKRDLSFKEYRMSDKMTQIALTVSIVFTVSYIPLFTLKLLVGVINPENLNNAEFSILKIFERSYALNHVANPFIYAFFDNRFRFHFQSIASNPLHSKTTEKTSDHDEISQSAERTIGISLNT